LDATGDNAGLYTAFHDRSRLENLCNESKGTEIFSSFKRSLIL
jgi:hypothetical protein